MGQDEPVDWGVFVVGWDHEEEVCFSDLLETNQLKRSVRKME
jgi:hypothetical protein